VGESHPGAAADLFVPPAARSRPPGILADGGMKERVDRVQKLSPERAKRVEGLAVRRRAASGTARFLDRFARSNDMLSRLRRIV